MKVCLTGGGNPHALAVARVLTAAGHECFGIGRNGAKAAPFWLVPVGYRYIQANVGNTDILLTILDTKRPDTIINFCAQGEGAASFGPDAWRFYETNCVMLARLVESLRHCSWLKRFVQVGSSEVYGATEHAATEDGPICAGSPYAVSKAAFDAHLGIMHRVHGFPCNVVRPSNCICEGMQLHRVAVRAAVSTVYGHSGAARMQLQGGGAARKSFMDSEDLGLGLLTVLESGSIGATYNCGPIDPVSIKSLVELVAKATGRQIEDFADIVPARVGEDAQYFLDSSKLRALGWEPKVTLEESVARIVAWVRAWPELAGMDWRYNVTP